MSVRTCQVGGAGEAAIEMRRHGVEPPERKIREAGIELGFRMAGEEAPPQARLIASVARDPNEGAEQSQPRMRQRIALAA